MTTSKANPEMLRKAALAGGIIGAVVWGAVAVAGAIMLVSFGAWPLVVWPLAFYWYANHLGNAVKAYNTIVKPQKWEQNVVINVTAEMTAEQISEAANRALDEKLQYGR